MSAPFLTPSQTLLVDSEILTPSTFSPFGTAITSPLPAAQSTIPQPSLLPKPFYSWQQPVPVIANQSTAIKYSPISPLLDYYSNSPSHRPGRPLMSMFSCFPRGLNSDGKFSVRILERHSFTTQTFVPLGLSTDDNETYFLVIVAPSSPDHFLTETVSGGKAEIQHPPDLSRLKAFVAHGGQAVTYGAGTWHAPMVVLGKRRVDFVVTQFTSGVAEEDCQEVEIAEGISVQIGSVLSRQKL